MEKFRDELVQFYIEGRLKVKQLQLFGHMVKMIEDKKSSR